MMHKIVAAGSLFSVFLILCIFLYYIIMTICSLEQIMIKDTENDHDQLKLSQDIEVESLELLPKNIQ